MKTLLAQLTDLHIREPGHLAYGRLDTAPYLQAAVRSIQALPQRPQAVVLTGDLTDFGREAEYAHLARLLAPLSMPTYLLPGNHDDRDSLRRSFPDHAYLGDDEFIQYRVPFDANGLSLLALDTVEAGASHGRLCPKRLAWLADMLDRHRGEPTIIAMHHPPFQTHIGHMDRIGLLEGAPALAEILAGHPAVERVICGHLHRTIFSRVAGALASTAPSPAHQVCLDLSPDAEPAWILEPPGFHLHAWNGPGGWVTHVSVVGRFDGPHPFKDGEPAVAAPASA